MDSGPSNEGRGDLRNALQRVYIAIDQAVGQLCERYADVSNLIFFSGHGMQPNNEPHWLLHALLIRMGLTVEKTSLMTGGRNGAEEQRAKDVSFSRTKAKKLESSIRRFANEYVIPLPIQERL